MSSGPVFALPPSAVLAAADTVGDPSSTRTVYITVAVLVALGVVLAGLAVWMFRRSDPELELLAPLEQMDTRAWRRRDPATQKRMLDEARPAGARPLHPSTSAPDLDTEFATDRPVTGFDDLADDGDPTHDDDDAAETDEGDSPPADPESDGDTIENDLVPGRAGATGSEDAPAPFPPPDGDPSDPESVGSGGDHRIENIPLAGWFDSFDDVALAHALLRAHDHEPSDDPTEPGRRSDETGSADDPVDTGPTLFDDGGVPVVPGEGLLRRPGTRDD